MWHQCFSTNGVTFQDLSVGFVEIRTEDHSTPLQLLTSPGPYKQNTENLLKYAHMINGCLLFQLGLIIQILLKPLIPLKTQTQ